MEEHTFNEWKEKGFVVVKGEKSSSRNSSNVALFTANQVKEIIKTHRSFEQNRYYAEEYYLSACDLGYCGDGFC